MVESSSRLPVKTEEKKPAAPAAAATWRPLAELRREIDRAFENFGHADWLRPFRSLDFEPMFKSSFGLTVPAVDIVEKDTAFEITAELPGIASKDVDVSMKNGTITIKGEKLDDKKEQTKDYYVHERAYGSFERSFAVPEGVDPSAIEATFSGGVLKVTLPKTLQAQKPAEKISVKAA